MTRTATRKCDRCRGPLGHRNESGVCGRCQQRSGKCKVCNCALYRDESGMCQDCRGVTGRLHAMEPMARCAADMLAEADRSADHAALAGRHASRVERYEWLASKGLPLFTTGDAA